MLLWSCVAQEVVSSIIFLIFRKLTSPERFVIGSQRDDRIVVENTKDNEKEETIGTLIISNVLRTDDGLYECIATNEASFCAIIYMLFLCIYSVIINDCYTF